MQRALGTVQDRALYDIVSDFIAIAHKDLSDKGDFYRTRKDDIDILVGALDGETWHSKATINSAVTRLGKLPFGSTGAVAEYMPALDKVAEALKDHMQRQVLTTGIQQVKDSFRLRYPDSYVLFIPVFEQELGGQ
jgi:hypothetical protein